MPVTRRDLRQRLRWLGASVCGLGCTAMLRHVLPPAQAQSRDAVAGPAASAAAITGFRRAQFGMSEPQLRQAMQRDFPEATKKLARYVHPREKTTVLAITAADLLPETGPARISYILGYASKRLEQVNLVWTVDGRDTGKDEAIIAAANLLRDHLRAQFQGAEGIVLNELLGKHAILVFRVSQPDGRMVLLLLTGAGAAARGEHGQAVPPLSLELSYIRDHAHPDIFRIEPGRF